MTSLANSHSHTLATDKANIKKTKWLSAAPAPLAPGQARMRVEHFAFTANNVTYAAFGDLMKYWQFFPQADAGFGCIPVWGYAVVSESTADGLTVGDRFYGYYPFATELVVQPTRVTPASFVDGMANRAELHGLYNQYHNVAQDPTYRPELEAINALLRPLYVTSFLIDDFFADSDWFGAKALILSSASSKTAYGTAYALAQRARGVEESVGKNERPEIIGLTSASNLAFTQRLGVYDRVLTYDDIAQLDGSAPCAYVDFSGSTTVRSAIHTHCQGLAYSCAIGGTHWQDMASSAHLPGPRPTLFFAPAQLKKRLGDWGSAEFQKRLGTSMMGFIKAVMNPAAAWMKVEKHLGQDAALAVYDKVVGGSASAEAGYIIQLV